MNAVSDLKKVEERKLLLFQSMASVRSALADSPAVQTIIAMVEGLQFWGFRCSVRQLVIVINDTSDHRT